MCALPRQTVPGIDANDTAKTNATFKFFFAVLQWVPLVDESASGDEPRDEADAAAKAATATFADWTLAVWRQLETYLGHLGEPVRLNVFF